VVGQSRDDALTVVQAGGHHPGSQRIIAAILLFRSQPIRSPGSPPSVAFFWLSGVTPPEGAIAGTISTLPCYEKFF
jgi:hypothetical protein